MVSKLPISVVLYACTRGHYGRTTDYRLTLDYWDRQLPLSTFGQRIAHVKVTDGGEATAADMVADLESRGFVVITSTGNWTRGLSMGGAYLGDVVTVTRHNHPTICAQPFYLHLEDDSPVAPHTLSLEDWLLQSCQMLSNDHELVTVRVRRRCDDRGPESAPQTDPRFFWSSDVNLQPILMRSIDAYRLGMILEANPQLCQTVQCERLIRIVLDSFSRSPRRHLVWECDEVETVHLGIPQPQYEAALRSLAL